MKTPLVAIVGRANVGKSTLFNKIVGRRAAIVNNQRGVTRDRNYGMAEWFGKTFMVVDTGGVDILGESNLERQVTEQAQLAMTEADLVIFVADGPQGLTLHDKEVILDLRRSETPLHIAVNKVDQHESMNGIYEFSALAQDGLFPIAAEHGLGIADLMEAVIQDFQEALEEDPSNAIRIAVVGRPNVGKSSLVNALLNSPRCIVSDIPGTTRDAVDSPLQYDGISYTLIDTAGIRRKGKTVQVLDKFSVIMALKAIDRCDVAVLVLDGSEGVTDQDATIAGYAIERGRGCLIAVNKWDLARQKGKIFENFIEAIRNKLKFLDFAPIFAVSAKIGYNLPAFFHNAQSVYSEFSKIIPTGALNECFGRAIRKNPMSQYRGKLVKLYYSTQVKNRPPTFLCFVNYPDGVHFSYRRYLANSLRKMFGFGGTPVRLVFSERQGQGLNTEKRFCGKKMV